MAKTANERTAELKVRLKSSGGKRITLNLTGDHVTKLEAMIASGFAEDYSSVIRKLIETQMPIAKKGKGDRIRPKQSDLNETLSKIISYKS